MNVKEMHKTARICILNIKASKIIVGQSEEDSKDIPYFYDMSQARCLDEVLSTENLLEDGI